jgi:alkanesulfonate monooxygenase
VDKRLWTEIAQLTARGNSTALVGTPEQVAEAILDYYDLGIEEILIRGFNPLADARDYGRELIPLVKKEAALRKANQRAA